MLSTGLLKMLMYDGFEITVVNCLVAVIIIAVLILAWRSTNTTEPTPYRAVFLWDRRIRRLRARLTAHVQSSSIPSTRTEEEPRTPNEESSNRENSQISKPPTASTSTEVVNNSNSAATPEREENEEIQNIFQIMDADTNVVRQRRLAYYENRNDGPSTNASPSRATDRPSHSNEEGTPSSSSLPTSSTETERDEFTEAQEPLMEHNYAAHDPVDINSPKCHNSGPKSEDKTSNITVKLKFLNDDLKSVDGRLEELLGDFKKRHFQSEYSNNKIVRLIFNGQVLQSDDATLKNCGLFDNCVVHCLIHQQRGNVNNEFSYGGRNFGGGIRNTQNIGDNLGFSHNNNEQGREWNLGNLFFTLTSIILGSAWYFRYEYSHLYTFTATGALVAITAIYTIFLVGVHIPNVQLTQQAAQAEPH